MSKLLPSVAAVLCLLPTAIATTSHVVGAGVVRGDLKGDLPSGNETVYFHLFEVGKDVWMVTYIARWYDEHETWPYLFQDAPRQDVEVLIRPLNQTVTVNGLWKAPAFLFVEGNYTSSTLRPLDQEPHLFFRVDRSHVAFAYDPKWPLATFWCEPDCPNLRGAVSEAMGSLARAKLHSDLQEHAMFWGLSSMEANTTRSDIAGMSPENATLALTNANYLRLTIESADDALADTLTLYHSLDHYPEEIKRPFEAYREEAHMRALSTQGGALRRLDAIEARIANAMQVGAFQAQAEQTERAIQQAEKASTDALRESRRSSEIAVVALVAVLAFEGVKYLFPDSAPFKKRGSLFLRKVSSFFRR